jgi:GH18 family chitinase
MARARHFRFWSPKVAMNALTILRFAKTFAAIGVVLAVVAAGQPASGLDFVGYLPRWQMKAGYLEKVLPAQLTLLDEVRYFGITMDDAGTLTAKPEDLERLHTLRAVIDRLPERRRPRLGITLGGWEQSGGFSQTASQEGSRRRLATNIKQLLDKTGATCVDLDWEHPKAGQQCEQDYPELLKELKQRMGSSVRVYLTVAPSVLVSPTVFEGSDAIDGVSLMTYDLGDWTEDPAHKGAGEHSLPEQVEDAVHAWSDAAGAGNPRPQVFSRWGLGAPVGKLGVGAPFYGRGFNGTSSKYSAPYRELVAHGITQDGNAYRYKDRDFWMAGPKLLRGRVEFAVANGLQHVIFWELGQDLPPDDPKSLLRIAVEARTQSMKRPVEGGRRLP